MNKQNTKELTVIKNNLAALWTELDIICDEIEKQQDADDNQADALDSARSTLYSALDEVETIIEDN
jgi:hypothetical protein